MTTYSVMQNRIADEINRSDLSSQVKLAIQTAISHYEGHRFWFNEQRYLITTVANDAWYDLPTDLAREDGVALGTGETILELDQVVCNFNNWLQPLKPVSVGWIDTYQITTYTGQPYYYALFGNRIRFAPTPNAAYVITLTAMSRLATLAADGDSNSWMTEGEPLIRNRAKAILWRSVLRNADQAGLCDAEEQLTLMSLDRKANARQTQRLTAWGY